MEHTRFQVYGYRWIVLLAFMSVVAINQLLWITFAPITSSAAGYYGVSDLSIGLLSMSFMIVYIVISIPASWVIDTYGMRVAVGIGAALTGIFGLTRGLVAHNYTLVLIAQIGIAIGQPFILNAVTKVAARWFPVQERATASGLGSLAMYLGIVVGLALTPYLTIRSGIGSMLVTYGIVSVMAAVVFFGLARERPPTPPCPPGQEERSLVTDGLRHILRQRDFVLLMLVFFVGLGVFNGVTTWIEDIVRPRGFSITQAGITGGLMVVGGVIGALILPSLSDRYRKRTPFIVLALAGATLGLVGITYATGYWLLLAAAFVLGFFLLSAGPIGFQYGAEIAYPAPEGTSNGLLLLMGQISGIVFILGMDSFKSPATGSMSPSLIVLIGLMVLGLLLCTRLRESTLMAEGARR
ncbi:MAG: MFS transporter [Anaerolineales bacterium]|nr:MFS transporter [Anaerolineales bacterium]